MIPLSPLYDEYIDRSKLSEQKNPFEYILPSPSKGVETMKTWVLAFKKTTNIYAYK